MSIKDKALCVMCRKDMVAIGEEMLNLTLSVYVYECQKCHHIMRTPVRYENSFKPKDMPKEQVVFT